MNRKPAPAPAETVLDDASRAFLSVDEVAHVLGIAPSSVRRGIRRGELAAILFGDRVLILRQDIVDQCARAFPDRFPAHAATLAAHDAENAQDAARERAERASWQHGTPEHAARVARMTAQRDRDHAAFEANQLLVNDEYGSGQTSKGIL